ncbi:MAG TPA: ATP-binding protein [Gemmatimonadales bacterium]|nr:ATP-binding protein [Gemmatimonadales bacterium]
MIQVLANVIGNAVRYAEATARISLDGSFDGHQIVLSVTDDGPGIPPDVLPRIFDKFVRAPTSGDAGQGTGLGLAIAKGIVTAHQGSISAHSPVADGRGTRIAVRLPVGEKSR